MVKLVAFAVTTLLVGASTRVSAQGNGSKIILGQRGHSCGAWTQGRQAKSFEGGLSAQWVAGCLSAGMNVGTAGAPNAFGGTDFDGLMAWIDNYCRSNPLDPIVAAADALMNELRSRARK